MFKRLLISTRFGNLLIMGLGQWLALSAFTLLNNQTKIWIIIGTICIAFAGYVINDFYDQEIDKINRPKRNLFERNFYKKYGWLVYVVINLIGLGLGALVSYKLLALFVTCLVLLFVYSFSLKKTAILGNIVAALIQAFVFLPCLFLTKGASSLTPGIHISLSSFLELFLIMIMVFAFLTAWFREWVKDIEDKDGDALVGAKTAPLSFSAKTNKTMLLVLSLTLSLIVIVFTLSLFFDSVYQGDAVLNYFYLFLILPLTIRALIMLKNANEKEDWSKLSSWLKMLMLAGVLSIGIL